MSFAQTPLGQGRRLDHNAFLGKPQSPRLNSHTSYAYGAPALGSRSPPKPPRSDDQNEPALARFAKLKRQNSDSQSLDPEKWSVKDTSTCKPNNSWASGSTRTAAAVPRSTSVEYESQSQSTSARRLAAPPSRLQSRPTSSSRAKPLSKNHSIQHVPDSEGEEEPAPAQNGRGKSPFDQVIGAAKRAIINPASAAATYYTSPVAVNGSYEYSAEERDVQSKRASATHKRNRMSTDNKAYKPSTSDLDNSDEDFTDDDGKQKRRKKKKRESVGGPLTTLPVAGYDKRKKKAKKGSKGNAGEVEEGSDSDSHATDKQSAPRGSVPPSRRSAQPEQSEFNPDTSFEEAEQGLHSIPEVDDEDIVPITHQKRARSRSRGPSAARSFQPGAFMGTVVRVIFTFFLLCGKVIGTTLEVILLRPTRAISRSPLGAVFKYAFLLALLLLASRALPDLGLPWGGNKVFHAPDVPAGNIAEIAERLRRMETALSGLSLDSERVRNKVEEESRLNAELVGKMGALETRVERESVRAHEAEAASRDAASSGIKNVKQEMETLQALVEAFSQQQGGGGSAASDEEARAKLKALEERVGSVEGGVRDAIELSKKGAAPASSVGAAWWSKSGKSGLTIKSSDGTDVTALIADLVNKAVGMYGKDNIARQDFALHSSGGLVIPSLTSPTYEVRPSSLRGKVVGYVTGNGFFVGRPPVTAIHYDLHDGHCWPFAGSQGQLGVVLARPVYIEDITIDHVAAEVAVNMQTSAPRDMEVWAMTLPKSMEYIRIASFRYDLDAPNNIQTFPVDDEIKALRIDFGIVVLMVKSNWGMDAFTCLYRMRVHGQMLDAETPSPEELSS
ncbi:UNC-like C-terminal-domain-containing protein [Mycena latifolia]|nr:UNC-like C-terminal-domain-containing protein [Mycena latifolia]